MNTHYSKPLDWNDKLLESQRATIDKWYNLYDGSNAKIFLDVAESLLDDLNTPGFIAKIHELYNNAIKGDIKSKKLFNSACKLLGLFDFDKKKWDDFKKSNTDVSESFILQKINARLAAKKKGDFKLADEIRNELLDKGIIIEDEKEKSIWKYK